MKKIIILSLLFFCSWGNAQSYNIYQVASFVNGLEQEKSQSSNKIIIDENENKIIDRMDGFEDDIYLIKKKEVISPNQIVFYCDDENGRDIIITVDIFYKYIKLMRSANILLKREGDYMKYYFH